MDQTGRIATKFPQMGDAFNQYTTVGLSKAASTGVCRPF